MGTRARIEDFPAGLMLREHQEADASPWAARSQVLLATCQQFGLSRPHFKARHCPL